MIFSDVYFGTAGRLFDPASGKITDPAYAERVDKFLNELVWMARALRFAANNCQAASRMADMALVVSRRFSVLDR